MKKMMFLVLGLSALVLAGCTSKVQTDAQVRVEATVVPEATQTPESSPQGAAVQMDSSTSVEINKNDTPDLILKDLDSTSISTETFN